MASNKRKQDEKHLKTLREMVALAHNKQCFDCHQRGPTYVNMTIGSYVCTACSGLLRGLNPPHRVKSISMASFTPDEMEFLKCHGNELCRKVWLGLYDNRMGNQSESREESKVKDFMTQKYERKRYYVAPTETMKEEAKRMNESSVSKTPATKPLKSLLGENAPRLQVGTNQDEVTEVVETTNIPEPEVGQGEVITTNILMEHKTPAAATPPPIVHSQSSTPQSPGNRSLQSSKSSGSTAMDLLGDLGGDPFASSAPPAQPTGGGFADFGNFGSSSSQPPAFAQSTPLQPAGSSVSAPQPAAFNGVSAPPASSAPGLTTGPPALGGNKYSNLGDLFSMPSETETSTANTGWSAMTTTSNTSNTGAINWGGGGGDSTSTASTGGGINWGGESSSTAGTGGAINWGTSSSTGSAGTGVGWGSTSSTSAQAPTQPNVANPFGGSSGTTLSSQTPGSMPGMSQPAAANPFGGQPATQSAGFGAFGTQTSNAPQAGGFGQFGANAAVSSGAGFGQFGGMQNGGFGGAGTVSSAGGGFGGTQTNTSTGFGGQPAHGFGGQAAGQPGFGAQPGFGQQPPQQMAGFGQGGAMFGGQPAAQGFGQSGAGFGGQVPGQQAGFGGQVPGQVAGQQQGFGVPAQGGWGQVAGGQPSTVNPFMSTAQQYSATAPKTGTTNPFL